VYDRFELLVSTSVTSAVTTTRSLTSPIGNWRSTASSPPTFKVTPARTMVLNPGAAAEIEYSPGTRLGIL
jgi:hypothetical protein